MSRSSRANGWWCSPRAASSASRPGARAHLNALDPALAACAHYFGVAQADIETIAIEYQEFKDARHEASVASAETRTRARAADLAGAAVKAA
ncbi:hypothetical protein P5P81_19630 [Tritonibacter mobilis]|nr:hypothetical protein [Tritonibacter mobilis]